MYCTRTVTEAFCSESGTCNLLLQLIVAGEATELSFSMFTGFRCFQVAERSIIDRIIRHSEQFRRMYMRWGLLIKNWIDNSSWELQVESHRWLIAERVLQIVNESKNGFLHQLLATQPWTKIKHNFFSLPFQFLPFNFPPPPQWQIPSFVKRSFLRLTGCPKGNKRMLTGGRKKRKFILLFSAIVHSF